MKRKITVGLAALLAVFIMACGEDAPKNPTPEPVSTTPSPITHPTR